MTLKLVIPELLILLAFTGYLVHHYAAVKTPAYLIGVTYLAWYLGFLGILLLPTDISHVQNEGIASISILRTWQWVYWMTFFIGWAICPLLQDFCLAGDFTAKERMATAVKKNMRLLSIATIVAVLVLIYLAIFKRGHLGEVLGWLMAGGNTYGLMLIVVLLGHGLVEVPRGLFREAAPEKALTRLYFRAAELDTALYDAMFELEDAENEVAMLSAVVEEKSLIRPEETEAFNNYIAIIQHTLHRFPHDIEESHGDVLSRRLKWEDLRTSTFTACHSRLRQAQVTYSTRKSQWDTLVHRISVLESVVQETLPKPGHLSAGMGSSSFESVDAQLIHLKALARWYWLTQLRVAWLRGLAFLAGGLSLIILWSYCALFVGFNLSPLGLLLEELTGAFPVQLATMTPLVYMSICLYRTLFKLKLFGQFSLQAPRLSQPSALLFNAQQMIRLQFPLGYSFLLMLKYHRTTSLQLLMSNMTVVPILGTSFNHYAPVVMVILCLFTLFSGYARLMKLIGVEHEDIANMADPESAEKIAEGKQLIQRKRQKAHFKGVKGSAIHVAEDGIKAMKKNNSLTFDPQNFEIKEHSTRTYYNQF